MHPADKPAKRQCNKDSGVWLVFYRIAQRHLERAGGLAGSLCGRVGDARGAVNRLGIEVLSGIDTSSATLPACFLASFNARLRSALELDIRVSDIVYLPLKTLTVA